VSVAVRGKSKPACEQTDSITNTRVAKVWLYENFAETGSYELSSPSYISNMSCRYYFPYRPFLQMTAIAQILLFPCLCTPSQQVTCLHLFLDNLLHSYPKLFIHTVPLFVPSLMRTVASFILATSYVWPVNLLLALLPGR
jgi:hypothetical protein